MKKMGFINEGFWRVVGFGFLVLLLVMGGVDLSGRAEAKTFIVASKHEAKTMDPNDTMDFTMFTVRDNLYDGLTRYQKNPPVLEPWLAESWKASPDAREFTFYLRKGVLFHDGSEMTSEDVVYSAKKLLHGGKGIAGTLNKFVDPSRTKALDKYTVKFTLKQPCAAFDGLAQFIYVLNKKVLQRHEEGGDYGNKWLAKTGTRLGKDGVGTGAYAIKEWKPAENYWTYEKFPKYFKGWEKPHMKDVRIETVYEAATQIMGVKSGRYHYVETTKTYDEMQELMKSPLLQEFHASIPRLEYIHLHNRKPPTSDLHFRKALNYAFDFDTYVNQIMRGYSERSIGYIPPSMFGSLDPKKEFHYTYDLKKAREELAKCKVDYKKYEPLVIGALQGYAVDITKAEMVVAKLALLGIKATIKLVTWPTWQQEVSKPETAYHIGPMGCSPYYIDPDHWSRLADPRGFGTHMGASWYENPKVTELHMKALATPDKKEREKLYQEAQRIELQDASHIWVQQMNYHNAVNKDIGGLDSFSPYGGLQRFRELYFKSEWK